MLARLFTEHDDRPVEDKIVLLRDITWADYQRHHLETRGDHSAPRFAYLEGVLEIMSPSLTHENLKSMIGRLVEVWCLEKGVEFRACYVFGEVSDPQQPDLAIELSGLQAASTRWRFTRKLEVREVWFWRRGRLTVHALRGDTYQEAPHSDVLPGIDLADLARFLDRPTTSQAIREYRASLQARP